MTTQTVQRSQATPLTEAVRAVKKHPRSADCDLRTKRREPSRTFDLCAREDPDAREREGSEPRTETAIATRTSVRSKSPTTGRRAHLARSHSRARQVARRSRAHEGTHASARPATPPFIGTFPPPGTRTRSSPDPRPRAPLPGRAHAAATAARVARAPAWSMVLVVSSGMRPTRQSVAAEADATVLTAAGSERVSSECASSRLSTPTLAAVSPNRLSGPCSSAGRKPCESTPRGGGRRERRRWMTRAAAATGGGGQTTRAAAAAANRRDVASRRPTEPESRRARGSTAREKGRWERPSLVT